MRTSTVGGLALVVLALSSCDDLSPTTGQQRAGEAAMAARAFTPVPAMQFDQATMDAWAEEFASHPGNCRAAWLDEVASPRLNHATLRTALEAHARARPGDSNERFSSTQIFVGARDRMQPLLTVHRRRLFDAAPGLRTDIHSYWVQLRFRYAGDLAALQRTFVANWGGTPTVWRESHEAWAHPRYANGGWTLFVPDNGRHELPANDPAPPDIAADDDAALERWLDATTGGAVEMPRMPEGERPLVTLTCSYAMHEPSR